MYRKRKVNTTYLESKRRRSSLRETSPESTSCKGNILRIGPRDSLLRWEMSEIRTSVRPKNSEHNYTVC